MEQKLTETVEMKLKGLIPGVPAEYAKPVRGTKNIMYMYGLFPQLMGLQVFKV